MKISDMLYVYGVYLVWNSDIGLKSTQSTVSLLWSSGKCTDLSLGGPGGYCGTLLSTILTMTVLYNVVCNYTNWLLLEERT